MLPYKPVSESPALNITARVGIDQPNQWEAVYNGNFIKICQFIVIVQCVATVFISVDKIKFVPSQCVDECIGS